MSDCDKIFPAIKDISLQSKPEVAAPLVEVLKELDKSHIIGSDLYKKAPDLAQQMKVKGVYTADLPPGPTGDRAVLQQGDGKPTFIELTEADRVEGLRPDPETGKPLMDTVTRKCSGKTIEHSTIYFKDGNTTQSILIMPGDIEILVGTDGKPVKIHPFQ